MSDIASEAERLNRVDAALRGWRTETVDRRAAWDAEQAILHAEQRERRRRVLTLSTAVGSVVALAATGLFAAFGGFTSSAAGSGAPVLPPSAPELSSIATGPVLAPDRDEQHVGPAVEQPPGAADADPSTLQLEGEVLTWREQGQLWIQLDYRGADLELAWLDGAGNEVLERTSCLYDVAPGVRRCYIGRTARRIVMAREAGAVAGTWTTQACQSGTCATVAQWDVE
jgi:hypothetical protein